MAFSDSNQFLSHLKLIRGGSLNLRSESTYDEDLKRIVEEKSENLYVTLDLFNPFDYKQIDKIIGANIDRLFEYLPEDIRGQINQKIAIGGLEISNVNAAIVKHPINTVYAILINYGFIIYFSKFMSYIFAAGDLDSVLWCSECPKGQLSSDKIIRFTDELADNYLNNSIPHGPELLLGRKLVDDITFFTDFSIQFSICHEISHFLNGDCDKESNFTPFSLLNETEILIENRNDSEETKADLAAFNLIQKLIMNDDLALYGLYLFFIGLDWLYKRPMGGKHPNPIERYNKVIGTYYSIEKIREISQFLPAFTIQEHSTQPLKK